MPNVSGRHFLTAFLALAALVAGAAGVARHLGPWLSNLLFFAAWSVAVLLLFVLAVHLPLRAQGTRQLNIFRQGCLVVGAIAVGCLANVAVYRHDVHFDLSREGINTPPPQLLSVIDGLKNSVSLKYFYNAGDQNALKAKELLAVAARKNQLFQVTFVDLDSDPATTRAYGVRAYNTAVLQAQDRRVVLENTVDLAQIAYASLRVLRERSDVVCFVAGHGEGVPDPSTHVHFSHVETLQGHDVPGAGDVLVGEPGGLDQLQLALTTLGYTARQILPAAMTAIPSECSLVAEIGPRQPYAPGEAKLLARYLARGGRLLLMIDPEFSIGGELAGMLGQIGLVSDPAVIIDPLNHYATDADKVAIPYYPPHPVTTRIGLTIFPDARPIGVNHPPESVSVSILATTSKDSYRGPVSQPDPGASEAEVSGKRTGPEVVAVAADGRWPDGATPGQDRPFRLVFVGNSNFATNAYLPFAANGDLAIGMIRWLAGDETTPAAKTQTYGLPQIVLTREQMRDTFALVELILPLSVALIGGIVWWRRR
jgi:ABC-2 type transport system permease protein